MEDLETSKDLQDNAGSKDQQDNPDSKDPQATEHDKTTDKPCDTPKEDGIMTTEEHNIADKSDEDIIMDNSNAGGESALDHDAADSSKEISGTLQSAKGNNDDMLDDDGEIIMDGSANIAPGNNDTSAKMSDDVTEELQEEEEDYDMEEEEEEDYNSEDEQEGDYDSAVDYGFEAQPPAKRPKLISTEEVCLDSEGEEEDIVPTSAQPPPQQQSVIKSTATAAAAAATAAVETSHKKKMLEQYYSSQVNIKIKIMDGQTDKQCLIVEQMLSSHENLF